jgi:hypothetical protein
MKKLMTLLLAAALALAGCAPTGTTLPSSTPLSPTPLPATPAATASALPAATATVSPPTPAAGATPQGGAVATSTLPPAAPGQPALLAAPQSCTLLPGLPACRTAGSALPFAGKLALLAGTADAPALVVGDFNSGAAWWIQKLPAAVAALKWAPSAKDLAIFYAGGKADIFLAEGKLSASADLAPSAVWSAQDQLLAEPYPVAVAANGDRAWINFNTNVAYIEPAASPGKQVSWPLESQSSGKLYTAVSWVPGTSLVLVLSYFPGNAAMLTGGTLNTLDAQTGKLVELKAMARLVPQYQWHPSEKGTLVLAESGTSPSMGGQRLAILNVLSGQKTYLVGDESVSVAWPSYTPDGKAVIFAATLPAALAGPGHPYGALAIYRVPVQTGVPERLTTPPAGFQDQAPRLLVDGVHFLYYRLSTAADSPRQLSLRLGALDGSLDAELVAPIRAPQCFALPADCNWASVIAVSN